MTPRRTILVIEDEAKLRQLMQSALAADYEIATASNGSEGLLQVKAVQPDLILLDLRMPEMDGLEVLARLKENRKTGGIPVIIVSAKGESDSLFAGQRAGAVDYLIKPFQLEELTRVIQRQMVALGD